MNQDQAKPEILLESGTNELEVLVFTVGPTRYGVNVFKVREIIGQVSVVKVPMTHPAVVGVFKLRESVRPLVDLQLYLHPGIPSKGTHRSVILMEFNDSQIGFLVDSVDRIYRLSWNDVRPMPMAQDTGDSIITSVCEADGQLALMVDFEKIAFDINGDENMFKVAGGASTALAIDRGRQHVLLAEDSPTIRGAIESNLIEAGYGRVTAAANGGEAWSMLEASLGDGGTKPFTLVVTDIEMPKMDGLHLCKRVKEHRQLQHLPVVVFSSLVSDSNLKKCKVVGADAAITKPKMGKLVELLDQLLGIDGSPNDTTEKELLLAID